MIDRYSSKEMRQLWSLQNKFLVWKQIEIDACEYWHNQKKIPTADWQQIQQKAHFEVERVLEIEEEIHHDVIAFLTNMAEHIGPASRYVHFGLTSSDIVDTSLSVLLVRASGLISKQYKKYLQALHKAAFQYKDQLMVGRTHGVHAEPTTLGLKLLGYYEEAVRNYHRLQLATKEVAYGKISGAVGSYSQVPPELEQFVLQKLNLQIETVSTQVVARDRHAQFVHALSMSAQGIARLAQEIRLLQKTESREVEEPFQQGQKGSSAMPHKRNPILCERMAGLARVLLGYANSASQNIGLWHERDISHSSAERVILPDATSLLEYMLNKMTFVVENLHVYPQTCEAVLNKTGGLLFSSRALLVITETLQITREQAYSIVQQAAMEIWEQGGSLRQKLENHKELAAIKNTQWDEVFDPQSFLTNIDKIFERSSSLPDS